MTASTDPNYQGENLVFIVGAPRSGTTWLQRLISCHPQVQTGQESNLVDLFLAPLLQHYRIGLDPMYRGGMGLAAYFTEEEFVNTVRGFARVLIEPMVGNLKPGELFLEKTPSHALYLHEMLEMFPRSRIIHILRDPRDVVASLMAASQSWAPCFPENNPKTAIQTWMKHVSAVRTIAPQLPDWQFHEVRYEELQAAPLIHLRRCTDFLGLEWSDTDLQAALALNEPGKAIATGGGSPIPLKGEIAKRVGAVVVEPKGFIRKAKVGSWQQDLTLTDRYWIWKLGRHVMANVGYPWRLFLFP